MASKSRRQFLVSLGALSAAPAVLAAKTTPSLQQLSADVLIIGGGTAGTITAIQAGRLGARTILVESGSQLGGTTTTAGVDYPGLFHAWTKQVIAGIGWELVTKTVELNGDKLPDFSQQTAKQHSRHQVRVCGPLYAALAEEACLKAGVQLRYYEFPTGIEAVADGWKVRLAGKGTQIEVVAKQLVDCTGNAAVVGMIGLPRRREAVIQPGTLIYRLTGYDRERVDVSALEAKAKEAIKTGALLRTDMNGGVRGFLGSGGHNNMHVMGADSSTSALHTDANIRGRQAVLRIIRFFKSQPGFEKLRIERLMAETGIRETYRIVGEAMITLDDYVAGRVYPDAICYAFYPIDLHDEHGVRPEPLKEGIVPTIPFGALIPKGSCNLMVAGRCLSSDRLANSALRVQAPCMAMGQAAGVTATLAVRQSTTPSKVSLTEIRRTLAEHGAIVPSPSASGLK
ncbi:MAG: FAD-dependent oxidoreductase [Verrucomicrobia bacterium]|nr:FAD-dependent oxidoreductase [Verrucomicrobiota bacterium]